MPRTRLEKKKYGVSKCEVSPEPALHLSYDEREGVGVVESEVEEFIDDYDNKKDEGGFRFPHIRIVDLE